MTTQSQMNKIIAINGQASSRPPTIYTNAEYAAADSDVILQPGVGYVELNEELKDRGERELHQLVGPRLTLSWLGLNLFLPVTTLDESLFVSTDRNS
jgi:hypothetical protein